MSEFRIAQLQVDLHSKKANVALSDPTSGAYINLVSVQFDKAGDQTESELKAMALNAVRQLLRRAAEAHYAD